MTNEPTLPTTKPDLAAMEARIDALSVIVVLAFIIAAPWLPIWGGP